MDFHPQPGTIRACDTCSCILCLVDRAGVGLSVDREDCGTPGWGGSADLARNGFRLCLLCRVGARLHPNGCANPRPTNPRATSEPITSRNCLCHRAADDDTPIDAATDRRSRPVVDL